MGFYPKVETLGRWLERDTSGILDWTCPEGMAYRNPVFFVHFLHGPNASRIFFYLMPPGTSWWREVIADRTPITSGDTYKLAGNADLLLTSGYRIGSEVRPASLPVQPYLFNLYIQAIRVQ